MPNPILLGQSSIPAQGGMAVTPSDVADLAVKPCRALWVGTGGSIAVIFSDTSAATLANVGSGVLLPISVTRVMATGTTASSVVALY